MENNLMSNENLTRISIFSFLVCWVIFASGCNVELLSSGSTANAQEEQNEKDESKLQFEIQKTRAEFVSIDRCYLVGNVPRGNTISPKQAFFHLLNPTEREEAGNQYLVGAIDGDLLSCDRFVIRSEKIEGYTASFNVDLIRPELGDGEPWRAIAFYKLKIPDAISQISIVFAQNNNSPETSMTVRDLRIKLK